MRYDFHCANEISSNNAAAEIEAVFITLCYS